MCYQHGGSGALNRAIVRGLWRMLALSGLLWMIFSSPVRAHTPEAVASEIASVPAAR